MTTLVTPRIHDLGGFQVRRAVPSLQARSVGPFVFVDQMGPALFEPGRGIDVRPHPHIGLATVTFLWAGTITHRDTLGSVQDIRPGDVNWMTAGRGIVHSERRPKDLASRTYRNHGLQLWVGLPEADEESAPSFQHATAASISEVRLDGATVRVAVGSAFGAASPIATASPTLALVFDFDVASGKAIELPAFASERALYAVDHPLEIDGEKVDEFTLAVLPEGATPMLSAPRGGRVALVGGEPLGHRFISWNFVSSRRERILAAEADWEAQRFDRIPGETEFIPLPARRP